VRAYFVDTWAYLALANRKDAGHSVAREVDEFLVSKGWVAITSDWILDETLTQLHALAGAKVTARFIEDLNVQLEARQLQLLNVSPPRFEATLAEFRRLTPTVPRLSLTDCSSFALMKELDVRWAFTADKHFYRAGPEVGPLVTNVDGHLVFRPPIHSSR
jgi:predicted nucleic acid-binding protein